MAPELLKQGLVIEGTQFPPGLTSPVSQKSLFLAGAGVRSIQINPQVTITVTVLGFYFEDGILKHLSGKWSGKSGSELEKEDDFFTDIINAPSEKIFSVTMLKPLPGTEFSKKVMENTKQVLAESNSLGEDEEKAIEEFSKLFEDQALKPGMGPFYVSSSSGLGVGFTDPDEPSNLKISSSIGNVKFANALLSTMIGKNPVSPASKACIAQRLSALL
ncbi:hypothetical protein SELMODRAFT_444624 [Selaginella moellendorffii]|uniref:Chalcone-flavonone isomerase family protein n=1 Tax=Selaginella moellendorffii TaxID=88036 RepID=D8SBL2_SELML|nr:chalcone--flavonone isomerase 3 [Selaginella moellendorffii]EFJ18274.1 hypothetical protein SELMODRAFT_444624 [Selaginella moellendorffii]|eukprot:XP_002980623.1 chalcone--flavonone isomerase 3 [Selaginella moellendorffii]